MTYNKFIRSGNIFELYEYEKEPRIVARRRTVEKKHTSDSGGVDMGTGRENTLSERQLGKRKDNARRAALDFRRLVASNLVGSELPVLLTLTYKQNQTDITIGYKDYRSFIQALRYKYGKTFKYVCVPEFQKRGAVHFHALFWGLPAELLSQERENRVLAQLWRRGFVFIKPTDGHARLSSYLAKYMAKAFTDSRLKNQKAYAASRNVLRPVISRGFSPVWPVLDDYVGDKSLPVSDQTYWTRWLGECRYRLFDISKNTEA